MLGSHWMDKACVLSPGVNVLDVSEGGHEGNQTPSSHHSCSLLPPPTPSLSLWRESSIDIAHPPTLLYCILLLPSLCEGGETLRQSRRELYILQQKQLYVHVLAILVPLDRSRSSPVCQTSEGTRGLKHFLNPQN